MDCTTQHHERNPSPSSAGTGVNSPEVVAIRAHMLDGLAPVHVFGAAVKKSDRTIYDWIAKGMPTIYVGRTPYINIAEAKAWLLRPGTRGSAPRKAGRPRKAA